MKKQYYSSTLAWRYRNGRSTCIKLLGFCFLLCGCQGEEGPIGPEGPDGKNSLTVVTTEPPGTNCENGGVRIDVGLDINSNGSLSSGEVQSTHFICNGADGLSSLISVTLEPAGVNCENGGSRVESGLDIDRNGLLDTGEVTAIAYICNGSDGEDGFVSLTNISTEDAGFKCDDGGFKIDSGLDIDSNGTLDASEIIFTEYVCHGVEGLAALVRIDSEPPGSNCDAGGSKVLSGLDADGDGSLDSGEITEISYVCNGEDGPDGLSSLVELETESSGTNCPSGGVKVLTGLDVDQDGNLDSNEVTDVAYICTSGNLVNPTDADNLSNTLTISGGIKKSGNPPSPSASSSAPTIANNQSSALVASGNTVFLPFTFSTTFSNPGYAGCYVQVDGASTYFDIPSDTLNTDQSGQIIIPVTIPSNVTLGSFSLIYCIYDNSGLISNILTTNVEVDDLSGCPFSDGGNDGLTIYSFDLGGSPGIASVRYNMFVVPDRIDVFYDDTWIDGTGSALAPGEFPPVNNTCSSLIDGYTGGSGTFTFAYDPSVSRELVVYMSGCIGGNTAWDLDVSCPQ